MPRFGTTAGTSTLVLLAALALPSNAQDANPVAEIDTLTQQWTDLEHQKDALRTDWRTQKPVLEQQLRLIDRETPELTALHETTAAQRDEAEQRRLELLTEQTKLEEEAAALDSSLAQASVVLHSLQRDLPPPLSAAWIDELARLDNTVDTSGV